MYVAVVCASCAVICATFLPPKISSASHPLLLTVHMHFIYCCGREYASSSYLIRRRFKVTPGFNNN